MSKLVEKLKNSRLARAGLTTLFVGTLVATPIVVDSLYAQDKHQKKECIEQKCEKDGEKDIHIIGRAGARNKARAAYMFKMQEKKQKIGYVEKKTDKFVMGRAVTPDGVISYHFPIPESGELSQTAKQEMARFQETVAKYELKKFEERKGHKSVSTMYGKKPGDFRRRFGGDMRKLREGILKEYRGGLKDLQELKNIKVEGLNGLDVHIDFEGFLEGLEYQIGNILTDVEEVTSDWESYSPEYFEGPEFKKWEGSMEAWEEEVDQWADGIGDYAEKNIKFQHKTSPEGGVSIYIKLDKDLLENYKPFPVMPKMPAPPLPPPIKE